MSSVAARVILILGSVASLVGCATQTETSDLDVRLADIISSHGLTGDPSRGRVLPDISEPLPQLGMQLFFTKALSGNQDTACVSCHHPWLGGGDGLPMSIGIDADQPDLLGPGRTHPEGPRVPRNAPTTFNAGLWDQVMFFDGRIESLGKTVGGKRRRRIWDPHARSPVGLPRRIGRPEPCDRPGAFSGDVGRGDARLRLR